MQLSTTFVAPNALPPETALPDSGGSAQTETGYTPLGPSRNPASPVAYSRPSSWDHLPIIPFHVRNNDLTLREFLII